MSEEQIWNIIQNFKFNTFQDLKLTQREADRQIVSFVLS